MNDHIKIEKARVDGVLFDIGGGGGVTAVDKLPQVGEDLLYKLPDGSVWSWYSYTESEQVKVVDVPGEHMVEGEFYNLKFNNFNVPAIVEMLNKLPFNWEQPATPPTVYLDKEGGGAFDLQFMWNSVDTENRRFLEPQEGVDNAMGDEENTFGVKFSSSQLVPSEMIGNWYNIAEDRLATQEEIQAFRARVYLDREDLTLEDFECLFDLAEEQYHYETVTKTHSGYRRVDDPNCEAYKDDNTYDVGEDVELSGTGVEYDDNHHSIIITDDSSYIDDEGIHLVAGGGSGSESEWKPRTVNYVQTPTKIKDTGKILKFDGEKVIPSNSLPYITEEPTADNLEGLIIVVLDHEPNTKYEGYLYIITESEDSGSGEAPAR